jgi:hypothetical protein
MTFSLHVDGDRWRQHLAKVRDEVRESLHNGRAGARFGDIVPVAKGNGYGFGIANLAVESTRLGLDRLAVGTPHEAAVAATYFPGQILVMQPWDPRDVIAAEVWDFIETRDFASRVLRTVASVEALHGLATTGLSGASPERPVQIVIEGLTSMRRFGLAEPDLDALLADDAIREALRTRRIDLQGLALHLPLVQPLAPHVETLESEFHDTNVTPTLASDASGRVKEAWSWTLTWIRALGSLEDAGCMLTDDAAAVWASHLDDEELRQLRSAVPEIPLRVRIGTRLWLGDHEAMHARGTVLAVHQVAKGRAVGYRQRRAPKDGLLVVVGGGTSHGVALEAPSPASSLRQRAVAAGTGALEASGRARSPFTWDGKRRWFAEPPHMQVSMLWLSADDVRLAVGKGGRVPAVGDEIDCRVRHTTSAFDRIVGLD